MKRLALLTIVSLLWLGVTPASANDGASGFWITLWPPATTGTVVILYGAFCALWAQNTGRNAWLWFVLGVLFSVFTLALLLYQNAEDRRAPPRSQRPAEPDAAPDRGGTSASQGSYLTHPPRQVSSPRSATPHAP